MKRSVWRVTMASASVLAMAGLAGADVSPGDTISAANKEAVKGLIPDELYAFVAEDFADLEMEIAAAEEYPPHPK